MNSLRTSSASGLVSLPTKSKVSYDYWKETWSLNKLISHFFLKKNKIKKNKTKSAYFASISRRKDKGKKRKNDKKTADTVRQKKQQKELTNPKDASCFFYRIEGHKKKHHTNYHTLSELKRVYFLIWFVLRLI